METIEMIAFAQMAIIAVIQFTISMVSCVREVRARWRPTWRMFAYPFQGCCGPRPKDVCEDHVDAPQSLLEATRLAERRAELIAGFSVVWTRACGAWGVLSIIRLVLGLPMVGRIVGNSFYLAMYLSVVYAQLFPTMFMKYLTPWLHDWMQGLLFLFGADLAIWHKSLFDLWKTGQLLVRIAMGIAHPVQGLNAFWSMAWAVLGIIRILRDPDNEAPVATVIVDELLIATFMIFLCSKFEEIQTAQVRSDIAASGYIRAKKTMERLLADMCDAVVELDPQLHIRQACPKLAGLLLRNAGNTALRGDSLADLAFTEEDRDRLSDFIEQRAVPMAHEQNIEGDRRRASMYMRLRDSTNTPVAVQIFHSCHHDPFDQLCHVVGVHEVDNSDTGGARDTLGAGNWREGVERQPVDRHNHVGNPGETVGEVVRQRSFGIDSESVASSVASSVSESEASEIAAHTVPVLPAENMAEYTMLFDALTDEIIATTMTFPSITGPLRFRANLADFIVDFDSFRTWLQNEIRAASAGELWSALDVKIVPVGSRREAHFEFKTEVVVYDIHRGVLASQFGVERIGDAEEEEHRFDLLVVLVFKKPDAKWKSKGIKERRRSRRRRSDPALQPQPRNQVYEIAL